MAKYEQWTTPELRVVRNMLLDKLAVIERMEIDKEILLDLIDEVDDELRRREDAKNN